MLGKVRTNDAYGDYCLPKSMGDKSVNRLRAITQTSLARSSSSRPAESETTRGYSTCKTTKEILSDKDPHFNLSIFRCSQCVRWS